MEIVFHYDVVCPWAYLASRRIEAVAAEVGATVRWEPVLLGGLLRATGGPDDPNLVMSRARAAIAAADLRRWAAWLHVPLHVPDAHPRRSVDAMRLCRLAPAGPVRVAVTHALYRAYWVEGRDIADAQVLASIASAHGLDAAAITGESSRAALWDATRAAAADGVFGVPTFVVDGHMTWGQDRLHRVARWCGGALAPPGPHPDGPAAPGTELRLFHDFASPFSYLAAMSIERVAVARGVSVAWSPVLLGAMFRAIGTPDVPLFEMSAAKRAWVHADLVQTAEELGLSFRFPSHFPIRTVLPLRVAIAEPKATAAIYRAAWAEDRRIDTPQTLGEVLHDAGFDAAGLLAAAEDPAVKLALRGNTSAAEAAGACGVPTFAIRRGTTETLLWGVDRLTMLDAMLGGWSPATDA